MSEQLDKAIKARNEALTNLESAKANVQELENALISQQLQVDTAVLAGSDPGQLAGDLASLQDRLAVLKSAEAEAARNLAAAEAATAAALAEDAKRRFEELLAGCEEKEKAMFKALDDLRKAARDLRRAEKTALDFRAKNNLNVGYRDFPGGRLEQIAINQFASFVMEGRTEYAWTSAGVPTLAEMTGEQQA